MIVDGEVLRVGSSNWNNRSLRLDSECDVTIDAARPGNESAAPVVEALRADLLAEHLGADPAAVARALAQSGSLIAAIEALRGPGRSLRPYRIPDLNAVEEYLADHEALDPEGPGEMFEPLSRRGLFRLLPRPGASRGTGRGAASLLRPTPRKDRSSPMSNIPSNAIPHAGPAADAETETETGGGRSFSDRVAGLAELARDNPKTAIAAGAAVAAGVVAAAAIPLARRRSASTTNSPGKGNSGGKSGGGKKA